MSENHQGHNHHHDHKYNHKHEHQNGHDHGQHQDQGYQSSPTTTTPMTQETDLIEEESDTQLYRETQNLIQKRSQSQKEYVQNRSNKNKVDCLLTNDPEFQKKINSSSRVLNKLYVVTIICVLFMIAEFVGGLWSNSIAIMSDAAHMLSDVAGLAISILSIQMGRAPATRQKSYGYHRLEVLGALTSIILIWVLVIGLCYEASLRVDQIIHHDGFDIDPIIMMITAAVGLVCNIINLIALGHGCGGDDMMHNVTSVFKPHGGHDCGHDHGHGGHNHDHGNGGCSGHGHNHEYQSALGDNPKQTKHTHVHPTSSVHNNDQESDDKSPILLVQDGGIRDSIVSNAGHNMIQRQSIVRDSVVSQGQAHDHGQNIEQHHEHKHDHAHGDGHMHKHDHHDHKHKHEHDHHNHGNGHNHAAHDHDSLNLRATIVHLVGDLLQSVGVIIASVIIYFKPEWKILDPICTYIFSIIVMFTTITVFRDCYAILMETTPKSVRTNHIREDILKIKEVESIDDFHCWAIAGGKYILTMHITLKDTYGQNHKDDVRHVYKLATKVIKDHDICHSTLQII